MLWTDAWKIGLSAWDNAIALAETMTASGAVIAHRSGTIDAALRDPGGADIEELGRLIPEKVSAFSQAGVSLMNDWMAIQSDIAVQMQELARIVTSGRAPSAVTLNGIAQRGARIASSLSHSAGRAIAPIRSAAMANERRLGAR